MQQKKEGKNFFRFGFRIDRLDAVKTGRFLLFFIVVYIFISSIVSLVPITAVENAVSQAELGILGVFGFQGNVSVQESAVIFLQNGVQIQISELCTGLQELFILVSAIIASIGISWRKRILGAIFGALVAVAFNFLRITATSLIILSSADISTIELAHNVLFRIFLFLTIAIAYIAWFYWAIKNENENKKQG